MKEFKKYLLPLSIIILTTILIIFSQDTSKSLDQDNEKDTTSSLRACYLYENIDNNTQDDTEQVKRYNREYIEFTLLSDQTVNGIHNILPAERDDNRASFVGVTEGGFVNVIATAHAEGETWQEQRVYKITDDKLFVGYQPIYVPQYQNDAGIYMYEDINKLVFDTEDFFLRKIPCESVNIEDVL